MSVRAVTHPEPSTAQRLLVVIAGLSLAVLGAAVAWLGVSLKMALAASFAAVFGLWAVRSDRFAVGLLLFAAAAIPTGSGAEELFGIRLGGLPIHALELLMVLAGSAVALRMLLRGTERFQSRLLWPMLWFLAYVACGVVIGLAHGNSTWAIGRDLRNFGYYGTFFIVLLAVRRRSDVVLFYRTILAGGVGFAVLLVVTHLSPDSFVLKRLFYGYNYLSQFRIWFNNSNLLLFVLLAALALMIVGPPWARRARMLVPLCCVAFALVISQSRALLTGAVLSVFVLLFVLLRAERRSAAGRYAVVLFTVTAVLLGLGLAMLSRDTLGGGELLETVQGRFDVVRDPTADSSYQGRVRVIPNAIDLAMRHPIIGNGLGTTFIVPWATGYGGDVAEIGREPAIDNLQITLWAKLGLIGFVLFHRVWWRYLQSLYQLMMRETDPFLKSVYIALVASAPAYLAMTVLSSFLIFYKLIVIYAAALALVDRALTLESEDPAVEGATR